MFNSAFGPYHEAYIVSCTLRRIEERANRRYYVGDRPTEMFHGLQNILQYNRSYWKDAATHPAIEKALTTFGRPTDWHLLALEQPQIASDGVRVAYVRNEAKREAHYYDSTGNKHLTATTVGKYLTRHWPKAPADKIRNISAMFTFKYEILKNLEDMIEAVQENQSYSCMQLSDRELENLGDRHPYSVYDTKYGWSLAVVKNNIGEYVGRALLLDDGTDKCFVRTYGHNMSEGCTQSREDRTQSHEGLQGWLEDLGYEYTDEWPEGCKFAKIPTRHSHLAPYLDPGSARVRSDDSRKVTDCGSYLMRDDNGEFTWDRTDGEPGEDENRGSCNCCGNRVSDDDLYFVCQGDSSVCPSCLHSNYTLVPGRHGSEYIEDSHAIRTVEGNSYNRENYQNYDIVELHNGDYTHINNTIFVESESEYYCNSEIAKSPDDFGDVVYADDGYRLREDCEWCIHNEEWIPDDEATEVANDNYVKTEDLDYFLTSLPREEVAANCIFCDEDAKLEMWDEENGVHKAQIELPLAVEA